MAFEAVLPYEDIFIEPGSSQATFQAHVYMKTLMAEDTAAEREVAIGKFKLIFPSAACTVSSDSNRHASFSLWETISGLSSGEYGLFFREGAVEGYAVRMATITFSCTAGTHQIGVHTIDYSDSNGLSSAPGVVYTTSVGRGESYVQYAEVLVKATKEEKGC